MDGGFVSTTAKRKESDLPLWMRLVSLNDPFGGSTRWRLEDLTRRQLVEFMLELNGLLTAEQKLSKELEMRNHVLENKVVALQHELQRLTQTVKGKKGSCG